MKNQRKIGILGGTFDPIHMGHLILAETAYDKFSLDTVLIMPTAQPPHKAGKDITGAYHRSNMIGLVCEDNPHFVYSDFELEREGSTYTADTLTLLSQENPEDRYYFIIGADSLFNIEKWKDPEKVFKYSTLLVAQRNDLDNERVKKQINYLTKKYQCEIHEIDIPNFAISSTIIIEKIRKNESIRYYVPDKVAEYIKANNLYKE